MLVVDLECIEGHRFEGWYETVNDYYARLQHSELSCPICNSTEIKRRTSGSKPLNTLGRTTTLTEKPPSEEVRAAVSRALATIRQNTFLGDEEGIPFFKLSTVDLEKN